MKLGELPHHVFILKLYNKQQRLYKAYCSGSIITPERVLTSTNCFLSNRKRLKVNLNNTKVAAGVLVTRAQEPKADGVQQWRQIEHIYSQKFYRFPAYNLAVLQLQKPYNFNQWVNKIPYATLDQDFDGVCMMPSLRMTMSWSQPKAVFLDQMQLLPRWQCERTLSLSCRLYYCTAFKNQHLYLESEGGGLICRATKDPEEEDSNRGILVGVTSVMYYDLPTFHNRVGLFHQWITDDAIRTVADEFVVLLFFTVLFLIKLL